MVESRQLTSEDRQRLQDLLAANRLQAPENSRENTTFNPGYFTELLDVIEDLQAEGSRGEWVTAVDVADATDGDVRRVAQALGVLYRDDELERVRRSNAYEYRRPTGGDA